MHIPHIPHLKSLLISHISRNHLPQLVLLRKFPTQDLHISHQRLAAIHQCFLRRDSAISLYAELELCEKRMWDLIASEDDVGVFEEVGAEDVCKSVVFFVECKDRAVGGTCGSQLLFICVCLGSKESAGSRTGVWFF